MSDLADLIADEAEALYIVTSTLAERAGLRSYVFAERVSANLEQWAPEYEAHIGVPVSCEGWAALLALVEIDRLQAQAQVNRMLSGEFTAGQGCTAMPPAPPLVANESEKACLESKPTLASGKRSARWTARRSRTAARLFIWRSSSPAPKASTTIGWLSRLRRRSANSSTADAGSAGGAPTREDGEALDRGFAVTSSTSVPAAPRPFNSPRAKEKGATGRWFGLAVAAGCAFWCGVLWFLRNWR